MTQEIRQHVTVQAGGRIELSSTDLPIGETVEVTVSWPLSRKNSATMFGVLSEDGELLDEIVREAYELRDAHLGRPRE